MKTPDEIKKGLEHCYSEPSCVGCPYWGDGDCNVESNALTYIQQLEAQVPKWISVEDEKKPLHGHDYLCLCTLPDDPAHEWDWASVRMWYAGGTNGYVDGPHFSDEGVEGMRVTHWMPLPEPPKEE